MTRKQLLGIGLQETNFENARAEMRTHQAKNKRSPSGKEQDHEDHFLVETSHGMGLVVFTSPGDMEESQTGKGCRLQHFTRKGPCECSNETADKEF